LLNKVIILQIKLFYLRFFAHKKYFLHS